MAEYCCVKAVFVGVIGMTLDMIQNATVTQLAGKNGCSWENQGVGLFCATGCCKQGWEAFRNESALDDSGFGWDCWTGRKSFCCRHSDKDRTWAGEWESPLDGSRFWCIWYELNAPENTKAGGCGRFVCQRRKFNPKAKSGNDFDDDRALIFGKHCDRVILFGLEGRAQNGRIDFFEKDSHSPKDTWLKIEPGSVCDKPIPKNSCS
ncbi:hypothetical protein DdX_16690 [Ditylenchus destructor]|uniref:Uncharacterized protein n=1 Tax=Ditylenchus destructor TaxID=166010 RepID=A0AAD4QZQ6_9BILA|nr:hypothetical protein DdX_16690 [Ditylenchus destructor]